MNHPDYFGLAMIAVFLFAFFVFYKMKIQDFWIIHHMHGFSTAEFMRAAEAIYFAESRDSKYMIEACENLFEKIADLTASRCRDLNPLLTPRKRKELYYRVMRFHKHNFTQILICAVYAKNCSNNPNLTNDEKNAIFDAYQLREREAENIIDRITRVRAPY